MQKITLRKAAMINATAKYINVILTLLFNAILSRILTPEDYGIVAVISVFTVFFQQFADMGFGTAVIQNRNLTQRDIDSIFSMTVYFAVILATVFAILSYPISLVYNNQVYIKLGLILSGSLFFTTLNMIPNSVLMRDHEFSLAAKRIVIVSFFSYAITVVLALNNFKYYALALQSLIFATINFLWNYSYSKNKFYFRFSYNSVKMVFGYSMYQFGASFINYFQRNLDNLLIGRFLGSIQLGYYNKSYTLAKYPISNITMVISPVLHPIFAARQDDKEFIYRKYISVIKILSLLGIFASVFLYYTANEAIIIMFGNQWAKSITPFQILSLSIWPQMLTGSVGALLQSLNNTKLLFKTLLVSGLISILGIVMGVIKGTIIDVSLYVTIVFYIHFFIYYIAVIKIGLQRSFVEFLKSFKYDVLIFIVLMISTTIFKFSNNSIFISFIYKLAYTSSIYALMIILTKQYKYFGLLIKGK